MASLGSALARGLSDVARGVSRASEQWPAQRARAQEQALRAKETAQQLEHQKFLQRMREEELELSRQRLALQEDQFAEDKIARADTATHQRTMLKLQQDRINNAMVSARLAAEYRQDSLAYQDLKLRVDALTDVAKDLEDRMQWAAEHGQPIGPDIIVQQRDIYNKIARLINDSSLSSETTNELLAPVGTPSEEPSDLNKQGMIGTWRGADKEGGRVGSVSSYETEFDPSPEADYIGQGMTAVSVVQQSDAENAGKSVYDPNDPMQMYLEVSANANAKRVAKAVAANMQIAKYDSQSAFELTINQLGGDDAVDAATKQLIRNTFEGVNSHNRYTHVDFDTGLAIERKTGNVVSLDLPHSEFDMTDKQAMRARDIRTEMRTFNQIPRLYGMANLSKLQGWSGYNTPLGAGDMALLYAFAKIMAPDDSAVREGELKTMTGVAGFLRELKLLPERWTVGDQLDPDVKWEIWIVVYQGYLDRLTAYTENAADFVEIGKAQGLLPEWIVPGWKRIKEHSYQLRTTDELIDELRRMRDWESRLAEKVVVGAPDPEWKGTSKENLVREIKTRTGVREGETLQLGLERWHKMKGQLPYFRDRMMKVEDAFLPVRSDAVESMGGQYSNPTPNQVTGEIEFGTTEDAGEAANMNLSGFNFPPLPAVAPGQLGASPEVLQGNPYTEYTDG